MDVSNAVNLSGAVQIISVLSCLNTLGDFLVKEKQLKRSDLQKDISAPALFAMDKYLVGTKSGYSDTLDVTKLNKLVNHLIKSNSCKSTKGKTIVKSHDKKPNSVHVQKFVYLSKENIAVVEGTKEFLNRLPVFFNNGIDEFEKLFRSLQSETGKVRKSSPKPVHVSKLKATELSPVIGFKNVHHNHPCKLRRKKRSLDDVPDCFRTAMWEKKMMNEKKAVKIATKFGAPTKQKVENELRKLLFLEGDEKTEIDFVKDWATNKFSKLPDWIKKYTIDLPEVFNELRYQESLKKSTPISSQLQKYEPVYNKKEAYKHVSLEDYMYLSLYIENGYEKIKENTELGLKMRKALYQLSIRQIDDPPSEYPTILYRGEKREINIQKEFKEGRTFKFEKFTSTSTSKNVASGFAKSYNDKKAQVLYEMTFKGSFIRAKVENLKLNPHEEETILIPKSKFKIDNVETKVSSDGIKTVTVKMSYVHNSKLEDIKNVMKELKNINI